MKNPASIVAIVLAVVSTSLSLSIAMGVLSKKKIAYVRSSELVYGYLGMKEAHSKFEEKSKVWQANVDTLKSGYQAELSAFTKNTSSMAEKEKEAGEKELMQKQQQLMDYVQTINGKMQEEDKKMTEGVLNQINSFVEGYGKDHGYEIILGTTLSGNLLYGDKGIDITDEVLAALNQTYRGEAK